jgi:hypothetical protein
MTRDDWYVVGGAVCALLVLIAVCTLSALTY